MNIPYFAVFALLAASPLAQANLLTNGDFTDGNSGFSSQYGFATSSTSETTYTVGTDPRLFHFSAASFGDHTTGDGQMLIANGARAANTYIWQQDVTLEADTDYLFSGWASSWGNFGDATDPSPSRLILLVDGTQVGAEFIVPAANGFWSEFQFFWNTGSTQISTLSILDTNIAAVGNDFVLDDLSLEIAPSVSVPEPDMRLLLGAGLVAAMLVRRRRVIGKRNGPASNNLLARISHPA